MVSKKLDASFRFLARAEIPNSNGMMRFSPHIDDALYKFDRYVRAIAIAQHALDKRVLALEKLAAQVVVGKVPFELSAEHAVDGGVTANIHEVVVDGNDSVAVANKQTLHRRIGKATHPLGLELLAPPVAHVDRHAAEGQRNDDNTHERHCR